MNSSVQIAISSIRVRVAPRFIAVLVVGVGHLVVAHFMMSGTVQSRMRSPAVEPIIVFMEPQRPVLDVLSLESEQVETRAALVAPDLPPQALLLEAAMDPPKIDPGFALDVAEYSQRAHLAPGTKATVMLLLDIAADGSVITAQVMRDSGDDGVNNAAIEYARATRWIPGTVDGVPQVMQASLTVILGESV